MFVPSHAKRTAFAGVDQVVYGFVVDLYERKVDLETPISLLSLGYVSEGISDGLRNDSLSFFTIPSFNSVGFA